MNENDHILLVCTIGGTTEPLVSALLHWRPARVLFIPSPETRDQVEKVLDDYAIRAGAPLGPGEYDVYCVHDAQDIQSCLSTIRRLDHEVEKWLARGAGYRVVADFTGGTKCMTAALALEARRWPCMFSYVGGERRTKGGVGIVETGSERVVHAANPWEALGYQAVDEFVTLFDQRAFAPAVRVARQAKEKVTAPERKRALSALENLAAAFDAWDRFDHKEAKKKFDDVAKGANDLKAALDAERAERVQRFIDQHRKHLECLAGQARIPTKAHVRDLLANARRRREEGRVDDAVARLYRAIEAIAQETLATRHDIPSTEHVPVDRLPEEFRSRPGVRPNDDGTVTVGLQDAYALLAALGDPLGKMFMGSELSDPERSPLQTRNRSILAHGLERVSAKTFERLWSAGLALAAVDARDLPELPKLGAD